MHFAKPSSQLRFMLLAMISLTVSLAICPRSLSGEVSQAHPFEVQNSLRKPSTSLPESPNPGFDFLMSRLIVSVATDITKNQNSANRGFYKYVSGFKQMTKEEYHYHLGLNREIQYANPDSELAVNKLGQDSIDVAGKKIERSLTFLEKIQKGFSMDFNLMGSTQKKEEVKAPRLVRYDVTPLGVKRPAMNRDQMIHQSETNSQEDLTEDFDWTISEVHDEATAIDLAADKTVASRADEHIGQSLPSPNFNMKLAPVRNGTKGYFSAHLTQADGLYSLNLSREWTAPQITKRHIFTVPLVNQAKVQKIYIDGGKAERTSLLDLKHHTLAKYSLNLHYWHLKSNYSCDVAYKIRQHSLNFEFKVQDIFQASGYAGSDDTTYKISYALSI